MAWKGRLLRVFAEGFTDARGERLEALRVVRVLDHIDAHPELGQRLDGLDSEELRDAFLELYAEHGHPAE